MTTEPGAQTDTAGTAAARTTKRRLPIERWLSRIDRLAAWGSAALLFLYLVSGFGMTKPILIERMTAGVINWRVAYDLHNNLHIPLIVGFTLHSSR